jgi:ribosomal protein S18 acetylase RimI-like enzyme
MTDWHVRPVEQRDAEAWRRLFAGYCEFYERPTSDAHRDRVWSWIHDAKSIDCLVVVPADESGPAVGIAHLRGWVRPIRGIVSGYLDDLFVAPEARGTGAVDALFDAIRNLAAERGWDVVRWTTAEDNHRAQAAYDRVATRTTWVTYDMEIGD